MTWEPVGFSAISAPRHEGHSQADGSFDSFQPECPGIDKGGYGPGSVQTVVRAMAGKSRHPTEIPLPSHPHSNDCGAWPPVLWSLDKGTSQPGADCAAAFPQGAGLPETPVSVIRATGCTAVTPATRSTVVRTGGQEPGCLRWLFSTVTFPKTSAVTHHDHVQVRLHGTIRITDCMTTATKPKPAQTKRTGESSIPSRE